MAWGANLRGKLISGVNVFDLLRSTASPLIALDAAIAIIAPTGVLRRCFDDLSVMAHLTPWIACRYTSLTYVEWVWEIRFVSSVPDALNLKTCQVGVTEFMRSEVAGLFARYGCGTPSEFGPGSRATGGLVRARTSDVREGRRSLDGPSSSKVEAPSASPLTKSSRRPFAAPAQGSETPSILAECVCPRQKLHRGRLRFGSDLKPKQSRRRQSDRDGQIQC